MRKIWKPLLVSFLTLLFTGIWLVFVLFFFNVFPSSIYLDVQNNFSWLYSWHQTITTQFNNIQSIGFYVLVGASILFILGVGFQYPLLKVNKLRRLVLWINIPLFSIALSGIVVSLILMLITLV